MNSDAIFSYITRLLLVLSIVVLFSVGYSAYKLIPPLYGQQPRMEFNGTHVIIGNILLRNQGLYPIELVLEVKANSHVYSNSVKLNPGEAGELELAVPAPILLGENMTTSLRFVLLPFIEAEVELPSTLHKEVSILPTDVGVKRVGNISEISFCTSSPTKSEISMRMTLLRNGEVVDSISRNYVVGRLCDSVMLMAPSESYILEISYDSESYRVPVVLP